MDKRTSLASTSTVSFADVAHQTLIFDSSDPTAQLVLKLIDTRWVQRLRHIRQTGNTHLVYMFAEHSRFGHSLGVSYLAMLLMRNLSRFSPEMVKKYEAAVAAAALLHDIGHIAPGSHLAAWIWSRNSLDQHEFLSTRVILEDREIREILSDYDPQLPELVADILREDSKLPPWTTAVISGGGWNADRGNWTIVDSAMCSVSYGRYNVMALIDAFRLSKDGHLVIHESRLDALTHFFMARDSMYRQVYQHRVLQATDALTYHVVLRVRDIIEAVDKTKNHDLDRRNLIRAHLQSLEIFCDEEMISALLSERYAETLPLETLFHMTESWWTYHLDRWCVAGDAALRDLAQRLRNRRLFKTVRLSSKLGLAEENDEEFSNLIAQAQAIATELGLDPRYYVTVIDNSDKHRGKMEEAPLVLMDSGEIRRATEVEPLIGALASRPQLVRKWLAVPQEIKEKLGRIR